MTTKVKRIIDCVEWIIIVSLIGLCVYIYRSGKSAAEKEMVTEQETLYTKIYESQKIETLKKENESLAKMVEQLSDAEAAVEIRYKYLYRTDTVTKYVMISDSVYHYSYDNDTIKYDIDIKAADLKWHKANVEINDKFTIVNAENDGRNQIYVGHSPNAEITGVDAWHRTDGIEDHFFYGPTLGVGYGFFNGKPDLYVGFSVGYKF